MSDKEKKYLDDEQVKKNLELFGNDREDFLKEYENIGSNRKEKTINKADVHIIRKFLFKRCDIWNK